MFLYCSYSTVYSTVAIVQYSTQYYGTFHSSNLCGGAILYALYHVMFVLWPCMYIRYNAALLVVSLCVVKVS